MTKLVLSSLLVTALPFAIANADRPPPRTPPQAAFDACAKAKQGDACTVAFGDRSIDGTCESFPDTTAPVGRPTHPPGPPPEALPPARAATGGDRCSVNHDGHTFSGSCAKGPGGNGPLACKPDHSPR